MAKENESSTVRVYALADPKLVVRQQRQITQAIYDALRTVDRVSRASDTVRHQVRIAPSSGWIEYVDNTLLFGKGPTPQLPDAAAARRRAEDFLRELTGRLTPTSNGPNPLNMV